MHDSIRAIRAALRSSRIHESGVDCPCRVFSSGTILQDRSRRDVADAITPRGRHYGLSGGINSAASRDCLRVEEGSAETYADVAEPTSGLW